MRPPEAAVDVVRVLRRVRILVVNAVLADPFQRRLAGQHAAEQQRVFDPFGGLEGHRTRADRGEEEVAILRVPGQQNRTQDLSPDGRHVILRRNIGAQGYDLYTLALDSAGTPEQWLATPALERAPTFSPDGDWIAYSSDISGREEVYVRPFRGSAGRISVTTRGGTEPLWAPDGTRLFYRSGNRFEWVEVQTDPTFRVLSPPRTLFEGRFYSYSWSRQYDVHPDGDRFLVLQYDSEQSELTVVVNFIEELRERMGN